MNKLVAAYLRLSKEDEKNIESNSIKNQKEIINEYAKNNNLEIFEFYIDDGYSGGNFERPGFKKMLKDIKNNEISAIITKDTSRLGRDFVETSYYIFKYFPENNIRYIAILENFDSLNPNGVEDLIPFQAIMNDMYLKDISKKIKSARHSKMKNGQYVGSTVPYGYKRDAKDKYKFVLDEYAANVVKRIYSMKLAGKSSLNIAKILTIENILPPSMYNGKNIKITETTSKWKASTVDNILKNEIYIGRLIQHKYSNINYKSKQKVKLSKDKWITYENFTEPIIDKNIFYDIQKRQSDNKGFRKSKYEYIFKGKVYCKECNTPMTIRRRQNGKAYYACKTSLKYGSQRCNLHYFSENKLNNIINTMLQESVCNLYKSFKNNILELINKENKNKLLLHINMYEKENLKIHNTLKQIYIDKLNNIIDEEIYINLKNKFKERKKYVNNKIKELQFKLKNLELNKPKEINKKIEEIVSRTLIDKVYIDKNRNIEIFFDFNMR